MQANRSLLLIAALLLCHSSTYGEQQEEIPSDELLDFLGQWEKVDDEWIDPTQLQDISMLDKKRIKGEADDQ